MVSNIIFFLNQIKFLLMYICDFNDKFKEYFKEDFKIIFGVDIFRFVDKNNYMFEILVDKRYRMMI